MCELAWEDVALLGGGDAVERRRMIRTDVCVVNDTATPSYKMRYWNNSQVQGPGFRV